MDESTRRLHHTVFFLCASLCRTPVAPRVLLSRREAKAVVSLHVLPGFQPETLGRFHITDLTRDSCGRRAESFCKPVAVDWISHPSDSKENTGNIQIRLPTPGGRGERRAAADGRAEPRRSLKKSERISRTGTRLLHQSVAAHSCLHFHKPAQTVQQARTRRVATN